MFLLPLVVETLFYKEAMLTIGLGIVTIYLSYYTKPSWLSKNGFLASTPR